MSYKSDPMPDEVVTRFDRTVSSAVQASLDALTRAIAWVDDESDAETALLRAKAELLVAHPVPSRSAVLRKLDFCVLLRLGHQSVGEATCG